MSCTHPRDIPMLECCQTGGDICFSWCAVAMGTQLISYTTSDRTHYQQCTVDYFQFPIGYVTYACNYNPFVQTQTSSPEGLVFEPPVAYTDPVNLYLRVGQNIGGVIIKSFANPIYESDVLASFSSHVNAFDFEAVRQDWLTCTQAPGRTVTFVADTGYKDSMSPSGNPNWTKLATGDPFNSLYARYSIESFAFPGCVTIRRFTSKGMGCGYDPFTNMYLEPYAILSAAKIRIFNSGPLWSYQRTGFGFGCSTEYPEGPVINCTRNLPIQDAAGFEYIDFSVPPFIGSTSPDMGMENCLP